MSVTFGARSDLRLWLLIVVQDLVPLVDHLQQAVGRHGVVEYDGNGHSLPKYQSFAVRVLAL